MTNWKKHIIVGFMSTILVSSIFLYLGWMKLNNLWLFLFVPLVIIYSLLPDIDSDSSLIRRVLNFFIVATFVLCLILALTTNNTIYLIISIFIGFFGVFVNTLTHRGKTHTIFMGVILAAPAIFFDVTLAFVCLVAYTSHLLIDGEFKII